MSEVPAGWLRPHFAVAGVRALMSTRAGGVSQGVYESCNLGDAVGDDPAAVHENRRRFAGAIGGVPTWLRQVHGRRVLRLPVAAGESLEADACLSTEPGVACVIQVADCLPVLFAAPGGVAAAHAGWRGLADGVLEATVEALAGASGCAPPDIEAWLGPCIGPRQFEVGEDVLAGFDADAQRAHPRFANGARPGHWLADLAGLARDRLAAAGVGAVSGGGWCTVEDGSRFFSYRRDRPRFGNSGRMAAAIWTERR